MRQLIRFVVLALLLVTSSSLVASAPDKGKRQDSISPDPMRDFNFIYEEGRGTMIDTFRGRITKDLVIGPDTTVDLALSKSELNRVYAKMISIGFFDMPEPHPPYTLEDRSCRHSPHTTIRIEATSGSRTRKLYWDTAICVLHETAEWKGLKELQSVIWEILTQRPEFKTLPAPKGLDL
jgi:hypothetical protein